jgi:predicted phosphodiesterase
MRNDMDDTDYSRRDFMKLAGLGGLVLASGLPGCTSFGQAGAGTADFSFVQLSDTHWGFDNPKFNPDSRGTLRKAITAVNSLEQKPDFLVFTGDLIHTTDDPRERRQRLTEFRDISAELNVPKIYCLSGENDASLDRGEAYLEVIGGELHYTFDHKGVHFIVLDNTSDPSTILGAKQLAWLKSDLALQKVDAPIVVFAHRPLFALAPQWDWATRDGMAAVDLLMPFHNVTVFYGHIHTEHHFRTGHIEHHAAKGLMFPWAPVGTPKKTQIPWDPSHPYQDLGFRSVRTRVDGMAPSAREFPVLGG